MQYRLGHQPSLHACRPGHRLRPDVHGDHDIGGAAQHLGRDAGDDDGATLASVRLREGGTHKRGDAAGGHSTDHIRWGYLESSHLLPRILRVVFGSVGGTTQRLGASGHHGDDLGRRGAEGRGAFSGIHGSETAAGTGTDVDQASLLLQGRGDLVHGRDDGWLHALQRLEGQAVLLLDHGDESTLGQGVQVPQVGVRLLSREVFVVDAPFGHGMRPCPQNG